MVILTNFSLSGALCDIAVAFFKKLVYNSYISPEQQVGIPFLFHILYYNFEFVKFRYWEFILNLLFNMEAWFQ